MSANGISTLSTKEERQIAKLELAQTKRQLEGTLGYRELRYYDIDLLPTKYVGNDIVDNTNVGGLVQGRPWKTTPNILSGLWRSTYSGYFGNNGMLAQETDVQWFDTQTPIETIAVTDFTYSIGSSPGDAVSVQWLGYFKAPHTANYVFDATGSDDELYFWIGNKAITAYTAGNADVYNYAGGSDRRVSDPIELEAGEYYPIRMQWGNDTGGGEVVFGWSDDAPFYKVSIRSFDTETNNPGDVITTCNEGDTILIEVEWDSLTVPAGENSYLKVGGVNVTAEDLSTFGPDNATDPIPFGADEPGPGPGITGGTLVVLPDNLTEGNETLTWSWYVNGVVVASASCTIVDTSTGP